MLLNVAHWGKRATEAPAFWRGERHSWKDYTAESAALHEIIQQHKRSDGHALLDVACGTGAHAAHLREHYAVTGFDLDGGLLSVARERLPHISLHQADMRDFSLDIQFDAVVCLFSSIGYLPDVAALNQTIANFVRHTKPGGVIAVEPWFEPGFLVDGYVSFTTVDRDAFKLVRMNRTTLHGVISRLNFQYLLGVPGADGSLEHFTETHDLRMFTRREMSTAFAAAGLDVQYIEDGLSGRGLYVAVQS